ncbi:MAG: L,D-transpeptidase family protein [Desulfatitalea sp.]
MDRFRIGISSKSKRLDSVARIVLCSLAIPLCLSAMSSSAEAQSPSEAATLIEKVSDRIKERISLVDHQKGFTCQGEPICGIQLIPDFYLERQFVPVWLDSSGLRPTGHALIHVIAQVGQDGLQPADYHLGAIHSMLKEMETQAALPLDQQADQWAQMDLLLTDAFLLLSSHLSGGRVNPETLHTDWRLSAHNVDIMAGLHNAVTETQINQAIDQLRPAHDGYSGLRLALRQLHGVEEQGGWPSIPDGPTLRPEERNDRVVALRQRLQMEGEQVAAELSEEPERFDPDLVESLKQFQARHGLEPDGAVGQRTLEELNVSTQDRIRQIELNLERWRWLPDDPGERYIRVNIADYSLTVVEHKEVVLSMRVVVGRPMRRTPVFSASMTYMVISPYWTVPPTIAVEDMLPKVIKDNSYFDHEAIKVYYGWEEGNAAVDPRQIDWLAYSKRNFPFRLVQEPGPSNALGQLKFMFPNNFSVYLHDTPHRSLFGKVQRDFSSGCIRVENALALAEYLLKENPNWTPEKLRAGIKKNQQQIVRVDPPLPVHLLYMTAWVDEKGVLQFRKDIYKRDIQLDQALKERHPAYPFE